MARKFVTAMLHVQVWTDDDQRQFAKALEKAKRAALGQLPPAQTAPGTTVNVDPGGEGGPCAARKIKYQVYVDPQSLPGAPRSDNDDD